MLWLVITAQPVTQRDYTETDTQFSTSLVTQGYYTTILRGGGGKINSQGYSQLRTVANQNARKLPFSDWLVLNRNKVC